MEKFKMIFSYPKNECKINKESSSIKDKQIEGSFYSIEYLHNKPSLLKECSLLLNSEWKRSLESRMRSIENSSENFPMSLILLENNNKVVGHCKLSRLSASKSKVFVESVVIKSALRGKGLGKFLMEGVEEVCKRKNIKWIYLATLGQEGFYEKLGYITCPPVNKFGFQLDYDDDDLEKNNITDVENNPKIHSICKSDCDSKSPVAPPPPPLPPPPSFQSSNLHSTKTFMRKKIV